MTYTEVSTQINILVGSKDRNYPIRFYSVPCVSVEIYLEVELYGYRYHKEATFNQESQVGDARKNLVNRVGRRIG
jgi:hypothetical protein